MQFSEGCALFPKVLQSALLSKLLHIECQCAIIHHSKAMSTLQQFQRSRILYCGCWTGTNANIAQRGIQVGPCIHRSCIRSLIIHGSGWVGLTFLYFHCGSLKKLFLLVQGGGRGESSIYLRVPSSTGGGGTYPQQILRYTCIYFLIVCKCSEYL